MGKQLTTLSFAGLSLAIMLSPLCLADALAPPHHTPPMTPHTQPAHPVNPPDPATQPHTPAGSPPSATHHPPTEPTTKTAHSSASTSSALNSANATNPAKLSSSHQHATTQTTPEASHSKQTPQPNKVHAAPTPMAKASPSKSAKVESRQLAQAAPKAKPLAQPGETQPNGHQANGDHMTPGDSDPKGETSPPAEETPPSTEGNDAPATLSPDDSITAEKNAFEATPINDVIITDSPMETLDEDASPGKLLLALLVVLGLIVASLMWLLPWLQRKGVLPAAAQPAVAKAMVKVRQTLPLGNNRDVYVVEALDRLLVVGGTANNLQLLTEFPASDNVASPQPSAPQNSPPPYTPPSASPEAKPAYGPEAASPYEEDLVESPVATKTKTPEPAPEPPPVRHPKPVSSPPTGDPASRQPDYFVGAPETEVVMMHDYDDEY